MAVAVDVDVPRTHGRSDVDPERRQRGRKDDRTGPIAAVGDLERGGASVGQGGDEDTVGAVLRHQARDLLHERGDVATGAADVERVGGHRVVHVVLGRSLRCHRDLPERTSQRNQRRDMGGGAAAVDADVQERLSRQLGDGVVDCLLHRMGAVEVRLIRRPPSSVGGRQHPGVLARTVHLQPRGGTATADDVAHRRPVERIVGACWRDSTRRDRPG